MEQEGTMEQVYTSTFNNAGVRGVRPPCTSKSVYNSYDLKNITTRHKQLINTNTQTFLYCQPPSTPQDRPQRLHGATMTGEGASRATIIRRGGCHTANNTGEIRRWATGCLPSTTNKPLTCLYTFQGWKRFKFYVWMDLCTVFNFYLCMYFNVYL